MTLGDVLVDSPTPAKLIRPADIFPLRKYRPGQQEAITVINAAVEAGENAILSAGTGTGKTITALVAALPPVLNSKNVRCMFVARTYKQNERVLEECMKVVNHIRDQLGRKDFHVLQLKGRTKMCLHEKIAQEDKEDPETHSKKCKNLRDDHECPFYEPFEEFEQADEETIIERLETGDLPQKVQAFVNSDPGGIYDSDRITTYGQKHRACPYYLAKYLLFRVHLVTCNYAWLFHPAINYSIFHKTPFALEHVICVVDEVHNLYDHCCDILSRSISPEKFPQIREQFAERHKFLTDRRVVLVKQYAHYPAIQIALSRLFEVLLSSARRGMDTITQVQIRLEAFLDATVKAFERLPLIPQNKFRRNQWDNCQEIELPVTLDDALHAIGDVTDLGLDYAMIYENPAKRFAQYLPSGKSVPPNVLAEIQDDGLFKERRPPARDPTSAIVNFASDLAGKVIEVLNPKGLLKEFANRSLFAKFDAKKEPLASGYRVHYTLSSCAFDARLITIRVLDRARAVVGMTGSFQPPLRSLIGFDASEKHHRLHVVPPNESLAKNIQVVFDTTCSSLYERRQVNIPSYARQVLFYAGLVPGNVGVFCPSYDVARSLRAALGTQVGHKPVFLEAQNSQENDVILAAFKSRAKKGGAIIVGPCQGKLGEGEDYPGHEMDAAIIAGFPLAAGSPSGDARQLFYTALFSPKPMVPHAQRRGIISRPSSRRPHIAKRV